MECSSGLIAQYESGETRPSIENLEKFARITGKPVGWFFSEDATTKSATQSDIEALREVFGYKIGSFEENTLSIMKECLAELREMRKALEKPRENNRSLPNGRIKSMLPPL